MERLKNRIKWKIKTWENVKFCEDKWIPIIEGKKILSRKPIESNIEYVSDVVKQQEK